MTDLSADRPETDPEAAIDELATVLAAWGRQALPPEQRAARRGWDKTGAVERQAFRTLLRPILAGGPGPAQRLWEAAGRRAVRLGLPDAHANEGVYAALWEAMNDCLARDAG